MDSTRRIVAFGPSIGVYQGRDIPAWYDTADGQRHDYVGVAGLIVDLEQLGARESVIAPGLIYEQKRGV